MIALLALPMVFALATPGAMAATGRSNPHKPAVKTASAQRHVKKSKMTAAAKTRKKQKPAPAQTI